MMPTQDNSPRALLDFYLEAGVDALVGEDPIDHFAQADTPPVAVRPATPSPGALSPPVIRQSPALAPAAPQAPDEAALAARQAAAAATTLDALREAMEKFDGCALKATASRLVFADGNPTARVMLVGEAPGRDEDIEGTAFAGRAGRLLDLMLGSIGLDRTSAYLANVVPWRPPGNRAPTPQETAICLPFIKRQIELANPDILVCLGKPAMQALLGIQEPITKARGRWTTYDTGTREIAAITTFHPDFLLASRPQKRFAWRDLLSLKKALAGNG
ncbi:MAG: uracil-DNA glycosylase [Rhodopseudomonas sp.]|nr:uracil-DNA glycosylase [Rhodopseudomonas sp.]